MPLALYCTLLSVKVLAYILLLLRLFWRTNRNMFKDDCAALAAVKRTIVVYFFFFLFFKLCEQQQQQQQQQQGQERERKLGKL